MTVTNGAPLIERLEKAYHALFPAENGGGTTESPKADGADGSKPASASNKTSGSSKDDGGDLYAADKERLRKLTTWIIGVFGAIAALMVAGSQLADIGSLDSTTKVSLFGWHQTRFEFALIGFGVLLGGTAVIIALCVWVQVTSEVTLAKLVDYPLEPEWRLWGWRVEGRVRETIEADLEQRGVPIDSGASPPSRLASVVKTWREARQLEQKTRLAALDLERELTRLRAPRATGSAGAPRLVDWTNKDELVAVADSLNTTVEVPQTKPKRDAFSAFEDELNANYESVSKDKVVRFDLVQLLLWDASYTRMRRSFGMVLKYIIVAAVLSGMGVALFAWSTHPPKTDQRQPSVLLVPAASVTDARAYLGKDCDPSTLKVNVMGDTKLVAISAAASSVGKTCTITAPTS